MNRKRLSITLSILVAVLASSEILLIRQNFQMRRLLPAEQSSLKAGMIVPSFVATGLHGESLSFLYEGSGPKRIYFYFTPTCKFCRKQFPYWKEIIKQSKVHNLEVMGLVKDTEDKVGLKDFLREMGCAEESLTPLKVAFISEAVRRSYELSATPVTLLADNRGRVEKSWLGTWGEADSTAAASVLGFSAAVQ
jgi:hypothetical protein